MISPGSEFISEEEALNTLFGVFQLRRLLEHVCFGCGEYVCGWGYCHNRACTDGEPLTRCNCWVRGPHSTQRRAEMIQSVRKTLDRNLKKTAAVPPLELVELVRDVVVDLRLIERNRRLRDPYIRGDRVRHSEGNLIRFPGSLGLHGPSRNSPLDEPELPRPLPNSMAGPAPAWISGADSSENTFRAAGITAAACPECDRTLCMLLHCHTRACEMAVSPRECSCWHEGFLSRTDIAVLAGLCKSFNAETIAGRDAEAVMSLIDRLLMEYSRIQSSIPL